MEIKYSYISNSLTESAENKQQYFFLNQEYLDFGFSPNLGLIWGPSE